MAQGTQCLHAISNYMRKVELKYQHVLPPSLHCFNLCVTITGDLLMISAVYYYKESEQETRGSIFIPGIPDMTSCR